ncbi:MAG: hypothetical protein IT375_25740 [Polyangiaceae bacterium]|nr:hypothetical protein [Polyangiaceae bacterium]
MSAEIIPVSLMGHAATNNLYVHVSSPLVSPYYIRTALVPNCDWAADTCNSSVGDSCRAALCCK